jgi:hypothetical protein
MKRANLEGMSVDDLWSLHVEITELLQQRMQSEKERLKERLKQLDGRPVSGASGLPAGSAEISQSRSAFTNLGRTWQAATLADSAVAFG